MNGRRIVFESIGKATLQKYEVPDLKPTDVLLESDYSAVSAGTECANLMQLPNTQTTKGFPYCPGYSSAGRVIDAGRKVKNLKIGDRVLITWSGHASHVVKNADSVFKIEDDSIDLLEACFAHIASFSFLGIRKLKLEIGESVMIAGMGILGAYALQIASLSGAIPVVVADFDSSRRELALQLGATAAFSPEEVNFVEKVKNATGGNGPNAVVEVTGSAAALQQALECISYEGRISLLGCTRVSDKPIDFYKYVHRRGISLIGSHTLTRPAYESCRDCWTEHDDYQTFMKFTVANKLFTKPIISDVVSPVKANEIYTNISQSKNPPLGIVFDWSKI